MEQSSAVCKFRLSSAVCVCRLRLPHLLAPAALSSGSEGQLRGLAIRSNVGGGLGLKLGLVPELASVSPHERH